MLEKSGKEYNDFIIGTPSKPPIKSVFDNTFNKNLCKTDPLIINQVKTPTAL